MSTPVLAATAWKSNAHMIEDCAALGYLRSDWLTLDPTYGKGVWWKRWQPDAGNLVTHDLAIDGVDFTALPYEKNAFDVVAYDPPYVCIGGRKGSKMSGMHEGYGLIAAPNNPVDLQFLINDGLEEALRVAKRFVLVKCQDYVTSGKLFPGTYYTLRFALEHGARLIDRLEHVGKARPQPGGRRQVHARRNLSTLFVLKPGK